MFEGFYIIPNIMSYSVNQGDGVYWRFKFKNFLKFYEGDFGEISMKTLEPGLERPLKKTFGKNIGVRAKPASVIVLVQH